MKKEELLKEIYDNVNYWLGYAEAKNAGLLAFNIAGLAVLFSLENIGGLVYILSVFLFGSIFFVFLALWSRFAATWKNETNKSANDNLLFYLDIAKYSDDEFVVQFYKNYFQENLDNVEAVPMYIRNISSEIVINARIASRKFELFNIALKIDVLALAIAIIMTVIA